MTTNAAKSLSSATTNTIDVTFDDATFGATGYTARVDDTLRFNNVSAVGTLTVYVVGQDGVTLSSTLLGVSKFDVPEGTPVDMVVKAKGTYQLKLTPPMTLAVVNDPGSSSTIIIGR